jgi:hypothetical protein
MLDGRIAERATIDLRVWRTTGESHGIKSFTEVF